MAGGIGWYRKDFELPSANSALMGVRFESVNYRSRVWLNGRPIGENTGAYIRSRCSFGSSGTGQPARDPRDSAQAD
jgi:hypothetical protein